MLIEDYLAQIKNVIDRYAAASFVVSATVTFDLRPGEQGLVSGIVQFVEKTEFHFREFLDARDGAVEKVMYSYHYQESTGKLILRYDNSAHKPRLQSVEHKHDSAGVKDSIAPRLADVLAEIVAINHWT